MPEDVWYFDDFTTLDLQDSTGTTVPVAGIQGLTVVPSVSIERLYTADSGKIEAQKQHEYSVDVSIEYAKWDSEAQVVQQWLGGGGNSTSTSWADTTDPQAFQISATWDSENADRTLDFTVEGITFEEMPLIDGSMGEYLSRDLSGTGEDITDYSMTDNTA